MDTSIISSNSSSKLSRSVEMKQDLIQFLPSEIIFNILSRLPVRGIATSKCVRKSWLDLLSTVYFVKSYLSKSVPALAVLMKEEQNSMWCRVYEFEDADEADEFEDADEADDDDDVVVVVDRRYNPLTDFNLRTNLTLVGAADGLLLLREYGQYLYVCNPITREYVYIRCPDDNYTKSFYGFGTSKIRGQHKVVQILHDTSGDCGCKCDVNVYTLETGFWRRLEAPTELHYCGSSYGAFVNGNLHWIGRESSRGAFITCFDLETERFSMLSAAPFGIEADTLTICALEDYLCVRYVMPSEDHEFVIEIWLMKEYGVEESWTEEYTICYGPDYSLDIAEAFYLVKVFKNGDVLIPGEDNGRVLFRYSKKSQTARKIGMLEPQRGIYWSSWHLTPSFLSLRRDLRMENVITF